MKTRNLIKKLLTITTAIVALATAGRLQPVKAQTGDGSVKFISYASTGIIPGEKIRLNIGNPEKSTGNLSLSFSYYLAHGTNASSSVPLYESGWIQVPPGQFRSSDVSRKDLNTEGEPGTGRAQVLVKINIIAPAGTKPEDLPGSLEVLEDEGGKSAEVDSKYRLIILAAKRSKINSLIGFNSGQSLRYSFFNPNEEGSQPVFVRAYTYDSYGNLLTQTDPVKLLPGEFHTFEINHDDLRLKSERQQVRAGVQVVLMDGSVREVKLSLAIEVVNNRAGGTGDGDYFTGTVSVSGDGF